MKIQNRYSLMIKLMKDAKKQKIIFSIYIDIIRAFQNNFLYKKSKKTCSFFNFMEFIDNRYFDLVSDKLTKSKWKYCEYKQKNQDKKSFEDCHGKLEHFLIIKFNNNIDL